jgi:hypothetical protein
MEPFSLRLLASSNASRTTCYPDRSDFRRTAHYDISVSSSRETSAPNLSHGQQGLRPRSATSSATFPKFQHLSFGFSWVEGLIQVLFRSPSEIHYDAAEISVIFHPSFSGVALPVCQRQKSTSSWRARATMACLRRRVCADRLRRMFFQRCTARLWGW